MMPLFFRPAIIVTALCPVLHVSGAEPCRVEIVEKGTHWPVPMVELVTTNQQRFASDNAGVIAIDDPDLLGRDLWFGVRGHGYEAPKDGFGIRGFRFTAAPGSIHRLEVERAIVAKRLGRLTGAGLFAESRKAGLDPGWEEAPGVFGCDSVQTAAHRGRLFWAWGDTNVPRYFLGVFHMTSATTALRPLASFEPPLKVSFDYFRDGDGHVRGVCPMPGGGPTWVNGYVSLPDKMGNDRLVGAYIKVKPPLDAYESGLCVWNDEQAIFERHRVLWTKSDAEPKQPPLPDGHPAFWKDEDGREWVLFGNPLPVLRCPATFEAWEDPSTWETLRPVGTLPSAADGKPVTLHSGSMAWNPWRQRWVTVFMEKFGKPSAFGELWYAESDSPFGPWGKAVKVLSHENYTFYNPRIHPEFTDADSPILIFEGTFTRTFADKPEATPRYDYNQILYRLDLDDPALAPARERPDSTGLGR